MKRKLFFILIVFFYCITSYSQNDEINVEAKGVGIKREDALQDALRNAISQACGVALTSETKVDNFIVVQDAISTKTEGYIKNYNVIKETPFPDRYEIVINATVSLNPLKADMLLLSKSIGGIRFLVMYDPRNISDKEYEDYDFAVERINEYLSNKKYRYIEKSRFDALKNEAKGIMQSGETSEESYVQMLGLKADAQFIIFIKKLTVHTKSEAFDTRTLSKVTIEVKAYDNCTAEGLGTVLLESNYKSGKDVKAAITEAVKNGFDKLLNVFTSYIGTWINEGIPYELRFYSIGTYRDFRELRTKLKENSDFGGQMEIVSLDNYTKLNCTFKRKPDELADKILDIADQIPIFKEKMLDVKYIYGRQINFAPQKEKILQLENLPNNSQSTDNKDSQTNSPNNPSTKQKPQSENNIKKTKTSNPQNKQVKK